MLALSLNQVFIQAMDISIVSAACFLCLLNEVSICLSIPFIRNQDINMIIYLGFMEAFGDIQLENAFSFFF